MEIPEIPRKNGSSGIFVCACLPCLGNQDALGDLFLHGGFVSFRASVDFLLEGVEAVLADAVDVPGKTAILATNEAKETRNNATSLWEERCSKTVALVKVANVRTNPVHSVRV